MSASDAVLAPWCAPASPNIDASAALRVSTLPRASAHAGNKALILARGPLNTPQSVVRYGFVTIRVRSVAAAGSSGSHRSGQTPLCTYRMYSYSVAHAPESRHETPHPVGVAPPQIQSLKDHQSRLSVPSSSRDYAAGRHGMGHGLSLTSDGVHTSEIEITQ